jgi:hypothetical protein
MKGSAKPIRSQSARFLVGGTRKGQGVVLLYPDKLASVRVHAELWGYFVGPLVVAAAAFPIVRGALAGLGREVRATTTGLAVNSRALNGEG